MPSGASPPAISDLHQGDLNEVLELDRRTLMAEFGPDDKLKLEGNNTLGKTRPSLPHTSAPSRRCDRAGMTCPQDVMPYRKAT